jgi:hypothetical protein
MLTRTVYHFRLRFLHIQPLQRGSLQRYFYFIFRNLSESILISAESYGILRFFIFKFFLPVVLEEEKTHRTRNKIIATKYIHIHCKKKFAIFPSPAGMSLTKLSLDGNNLIIPAQGEFGQ